MIKNIGLSLRKSITKASSLLNNTQGNEKLTGRTAPPSARRWRHLRNKMVPPNQRFDLTNMSLPAGKLR